MPKLAANVSLTRWLWSKEVAQGEGGPSRPVSTQQKAVPVIGFLSGVSPGSYAPYVSARSPRVRPPP